MSSKYLYVVRMDVAREREALFNDVYETEHIPEISTVPGVLRTARYRTSSPGEPMYLAIYDLESPKTPDSPQWRVARDKGRWPAQVRPYTTNRHHAIYSRLGGNREMTWRTSYLALSMMDVEQRKEALFNELCDSEHIPLVTAVPGVAGAVRYETTAEGHPKYLVIYELERPGVTGSPAFAKAANAGRWKTEVEPYTSNKRLIVYERIGQGRQG